MANGFQRARMLLREARPAALWSLSPDHGRRRRAELRRFADWCRIHGRDSLPASAETVALFLADMADHYRPKTVESLLAAVAWGHSAAGKPFDRRLFTPIVRGIRRKHGMPPRQAAAITVGELRAIVANLPETARGLRDRALLAVGFAGALRCSELVGLDMRATPASVGSVEIDREGARLLLRRSKQDATGEGRTRWLPRGGNPCPVDALERWLARASIDAGPVFRRMYRGDTVSTKRLRGGSLSRIVRCAVNRNALLSGASEPQARARAREASSHSLRVGFVVSALSVGVSSDDIAEYIGWKNPSLVFYYARQAEPLRANPARLVLGL